MLPLSLYIGILLTFGRLYAESEITVMNATGIGNKFLIRAALYLALITASVAALMHCGSRLGAKIKKLI